MAAIEKVPQDTLFVSEPDPRMFGNSANPTDAIGWSNKNWLKSRFHFNFAEYRSGPRNFGVLRVMNDDLVQPARGFGAHPHRDMEIITFVVSGSLTHKDSTGTQETLGRGSVQFMTAGTGVMHSEENQGSEPCRFIQSWIVPRSRGLPPNYGSLVGDDTAARNRSNQWAQLVSDVRSGENFTPVQINQDCNVYVTELDADLASPPLEIGVGRQAYMLAVEGSVSLGDVDLSRHDAARIRGGQVLELKAGSSGAMVLVFEMAADGRS